MHDFLNCRWLNGFFWKGNKRDLEIVDLYKAMPNDRSKKLGDRMTKEWEKELERCRAKQLKSGSKDPKKFQPSLRKVIIRQFGLYFMGVGLLAFIEECFTRYNP